MSTRTLPQPFTARPRVRVVRVPGRVPYGAGLAWQRRLARARIDGRQRDDLLILLEHEPVLTVGRGAGDQLASHAGFASEIPRFEIERGGDITYHGPGQLVGYPILDLGSFRKDLHWYVRTLEEGLIRALERLGVEGCRVPGHTGVWVSDGGDPLRGRGDGTKSDGDDPFRGPGDGTKSAGGGASTDRVAARILAGSLRKIASIGVHVSRWVTWHGFALNVRDEALGPFRAIVPCGIRGVRMTSLESEHGVIDWDRVAAEVADGFGGAFGARMEGAKLEDVG